MGFSGMIKRLITWIYERYCKEPEYVPTLEDRKRYIYARELSSPFRRAAWCGLAKPDYPIYKGGECPQALKDKLDEIYESNKPIMDEMCEKHIPGFKGVK
jgi:hypothetical protein